MTKCTGILKATVSQYLCRALSVYGCRMSLVRPSILWITCCLWETHWKGPSYPLESQDLYWLGTNLNKCRFTGRLHCLSHIILDSGKEVCSHLFCFHYIMITCWWSLHLCHWLVCQWFSLRRNFILLAPSQSALRPLLSIWECFGSANLLKFNLDKTQCIRFQGLQMQIKFE